MKSLFPIAIMIALISTGTARADDDCFSPMEKWQSRESVAAHISEMGITTERLRIDDGCYEIRGRDGEGNQIKLKIEPSTLTLLKLEVRFRPGTDSSHYLPKIHNQTTPSSPPVVKPSNTLPTATSADTN